MFLRQPSDVCDNTSCNRACWTYLLLDGLLRAGTVVAAFLTGVGVILYLVVGWTTFGSCYACNFRRRLREKFQLPVQFWDDCFVRQPSSPFVLRFDLPAPVPCCRHLPYLPPCLPPAPAPPPNANVGRVAVRQLLVGAAAGAPISGLKRFPPIFYLSLHSLCSPRSSPSCAASAAISSAHCAEHAECTPVGAGAAAGRE